MKFSTLAIPAVFATLAYATCFTGGASGVAANVQGALPTVCAALAGFFVKNEQRHMCVTDAAQVQWDFTLEVCIVLPPSEGDRANIGVVYRE